MRLLRLVFITILLTMVVVTTWASLGEHILQIPPAVTGDRWFIATLFDAYFGFTTFYLWVRLPQPRPMAANHVVYGDYGLRQHGHGGLYVVALG